MLYITVLCNAKNEEDIGTTVGITALLLEGGAKIDARDNAGRTPLNFATESGARYNPDVLRGIRYLVKMGADLEATDNQGCTPLHIYASAYWADVVEFLLEEGANINAKDKLGHRPLDLAWTALKEVVDRGLVVGDEWNYSEWVFAEGRLKHQVKCLDKTIELLTNASAKALVVHGTGENSHNASGFGA